MAAVVPAQGPDAPIMQRRPRIDDSKSATQQTMAVPVASSRVADGALPSKSLRDPADDDVT